MLELNDMPHSGDGEADYELLQRQLSAGYATQVMVLDGN